MMSAPLSNFHVDTPTRKVDRRGVLPSDNRGITVSPRPFRQTWVASPPNSSLLPKRLPPSGARETGHREVDGGDGSLPPCLLPKALWESATGACADGRPWVSLGSWCSLGVRETKDEVGEAGALSDLGACLRPEGGSSAFIMHPLGK